MVCWMVQRMATPSSCSSAEQFGKAVCTCWSSHCPSGREEKLSGFIENTSCWLKKASRSRGTDWIFEKHDLRERITWQPDSPIQTLSNSCLRILPERCSEWFRATFHTGFRWTLPSRQRHPAFHRCVLDMPLHQ